MRALASILAASLVIGRDALVPALGGPAVSPGADQRPPEDDPEAIAIEPACAQLRLLSGVEYRATVHDLLDVEGAGLGGTSCPATSGACAEGTGSVGVAHDCEICCGPGGAFVDDVRLGAVRGWVFAKPEPVTGARVLHEGYTKAETHFKCNRARLADFAHLSAYTRDLYQRAAFRETVHLDQHYFTRPPQLNPSGIVPAGFTSDFEAPHGRDALG